MTNGEDGGRGGVASDLRRAKGVGGGVGDMTYEQPRGFR